MLTGHGDDRGQYTGIKITADFSTNVWYGGAPAGLKEHLFSAWNSITRYPEPEGRSLAHTISQFHGLDAQNILISNGSTESIYLIAQAFRRASTVITIPAFAEYEDACRMHEHSLKFISHTGLSPKAVPECGLFFLCNPANPDGAVFKDIEELIRLHPATIFIIDEAFIEFTLAARSVIDLIRKYENLIVLRSLTKAFAIPGLRLGYIAACRSLILKLRAHKSPWSVNTLALAAGEFIFSNYMALQMPLENLLHEKKSFTEKLSHLPLKIHTGYTHYFLAELNKGSAADLKNYLLTSHGMLIRDAANFRGLHKGCFRVATLNPEKNNLLIQAIGEWVDHVADRKELCPDIS